MEKNKVRILRELRIHPLFWRLYYRKTVYISNENTYEILKEISYMFLIFTFDITYIRKH